MKSNLVQSNAERVNTNRIGTPADGLHITHLEDSSVDRESIDHIPAGLRENKLSNAEIGTPETGWTGFRYKVSSVESNPPHNTAFVQTCVRIFEPNSQASRYLHLMSYREALPMTRSVIQPSTTVLIPVYAFAADRPESSEVYISDSGMQPSLRY